MQNVDVQSNTLQLAPNVVQVSKSIENPPSRVGEAWPPILEKKWLAIHFGCWNGREISRRFRTKVLTPEVLQKAGISQEFAYSRNCKSFDVIQSIMLTKILRGFCLIAFLLTSTITIAQTAAPAVKYSRDTFLLDTLPGQAMITDSIVRMVTAGPTGEYRFEQVLSTVVVDAICVKKYRFLVRASDGGTDPFDMAQSFFLLTGGLIDPNRILIFKQYQK